MRSLNYVYNLKIQIHQYKILNIKIFKENCEVETLNRVKWFLEWTNKLEI